MLFHSFLRKSTFFFSNQFLSDFHSYVFHFDSWELTREPGSLHSLIRSLIFLVIQFGNSLISWYAHTLIFYMFRMRFKNHHNNPFLSFQLNQSKSCQDFFFYISTLFATHILFISIILTCFFFFLMWPPYFFFFLYNGFLLFFFFDYKLKAYGCHISFFFFFFFFYSQSQCLLLWSHTLFLLFYFFILVGKIRVSFSPN